MKAGSSTFGVVVLQDSGDPTIATVPVVIPAGTVSRIAAWTVK